MGPPQGARPPLTPKHSYAAPLPAKSPDEDDLDNEEAEENIDDLASDSQSLIGVSIGRAQTECNSAVNIPQDDRLDDNHQPKPAIPYVDSRDFSENQASSQAPPTTVNDQASSSNVDRTSDPRKSPTPPAVLPSPWVSASKAYWSFGQAQDHSTQLTSTKTARQRASTGPTLPEESGLRKLVPFALPSLPKVSSVIPQRISVTSLGAPSAWLRGFADHRPSLMTTPQSSSSKESSPGSGLDGSLSTKLKRPNSEKSATNTLERSHSLGVDKTSYEAIRPGPPKRTASDESLYLQRALSRASSLGDDDRWTNVHSQVNSRFKAIRDSMADSSIRMPRLPDLPSLELKNSLLDFTSARKRAMSTQQDGRSRSSSLITSGSSMLTGEKLKPTESPEKIDPASEGASAVRASVSKQPPQALTSSKVTSERHSNFSKALKHLRGDVVIMGGYRGSVLRSAEPPHRQLWVPVKVGLNLRKVNLEVGLDPQDEERVEETIIPSGMLKHIGPVDISRRLFNRLRSSPNAFNKTLRIWDFGYDWRLSPNMLSAQLLKFLESLPSNQPNTPPSERGATIIAHSLGGLITRHAINQQPKLFAGVIYAGVPQTCVNILGPLRNGDDVLLSSKVLTAQVNFTIRTSFALLPLDGKCFINRETKEEYPVDFFDAETWDEHCLSPCVSRPLPPLSPKPPSTIDSLLGTVTNSLPNISLPGRSSARRKTIAGPNAHQSTGEKAKRLVNHEAASRPQAMAPDMHSHANAAEHSSPETDPSTLVTIPKPKAKAYLARALADVKSFKQGLTYNPSIAEKDLYPPAAVIYGKSVPTVYGAHVASRESIKRADAYDDLAFASGDGVVLARAAQVPEGYTVARGGCVSSERGHVSLLGDLEAVGRCLCAIEMERRERVRGLTSKRPA